MKVIDLLNKIANGEEVPKKIRFNDIEYTLDQNIDSYWNNEKKQWFESRIYGHCLNNEVEILEEPKEIPEKLDIGKMLQTKKWKRDKKIWETINSIIDYLESKGE